MPAAQGIHRLIANIARGQNTRYHAGHVPNDEEAVLGDLFDRREEFELQIDACAIGARAKAIKARAVRLIRSMTTDLVGNPVL